MSDRNPRRLCVSHSPFNEADFVGRGRVILGHLANRFGSGFGMRGVIDPISMLNDYLNTGFDDFVGLCRNCRKMPSHFPHIKSFNLLQFSPCV